MKCERENELRETCKPNPSCRPTGQTKINLFYSILHNYNSTFGNIDNE